MMIRKYVYFLDFVFLLLFHAALSLTSAVVSHATSSAKFLALSASVSDDIGRTLSGE
jgi:hypothetical protein